MKRVKKTVFTCLLAGILLGGTISQASTADSSWKYINYAGRTDTSDRYKEGSGNVYCYPIKGGNVYVTVKKKSNTSKAYSKKVKLKKGTQYTIVNSAGARSYVFLRFNPVANDSTVNSGTWSPDASTDYTVIGK